MQSTVPQRRSRLASSVAVASILFALSGCSWLFPDAFTSYAKIEQFADSLDIETDASVLAEGNHAEGIGNSLIHHITVYDGTAAADELTDSLQRAGFTPDSADNPEAIWSYTDENGDTYNARIRELKPGDAVMFERDDGFEVESPATALDLYTVA